MRSATCSRPPGSGPRASASRTRCAPRPARRGAAAARRPARRVAVHPGPPGAALAVLQRDGRQRADHGDLAADHRAHARPPRVPAVAVRLRVRRTLRRRPDRLPAGEPARHPVRTAPGHAHRRDAARLLADRAGLHRPWRGRHRARRRRPARPGHLLWRVQSGAGHLPAGADRAGPGGPHPVRLVGQQQHEHRGPDGPVGPAGHHHQPARRDRDGRAPAAGHPAAAAAAWPRAPGQRELRLRSGRRPGQAGPVTAARAFSPFGGV